MAEILTFPINRRAADRQARADKRRARREYWDDIRVRLIEGRPIKLPTNEELLNESER